MWFTIGLIALGLVLVYVYLIWNFNYWKNRGIPGPKPIPLVGAFPDAFMQKRNMVYEVDSVYK